MTLKLAIVRNTFYFCGKVSLSLKNTAHNPAVIDVNSLTDQEVTGLVRAIKTGVIKAVEGEAELLSKFKEVSDKRKTKKESQEVVETVTEEVKEPEIVEQPVEVKEEKTSEKEEIKEEVVEIKEEKVEEEVKTAPKATVKKTTPNRKTTTK